MLPLLPQYSSCGMYRQAVLSLLLDIVHVVCIVRLGGGGGRDGESKFEGTPLVEVVVALESLLCMLKVTTQVVCAFGGALNEPSVCLQNPVTIKGCHVATAKEEAGLHCNSNAASAGTGSTSVVMSVTSCFAALLSRGEFSEQVGRDRCALLCTRARSQCLGIMV